MLARHRIGEVEVDLCPGCGGLWLDRSELQQLAAAPAASLAALGALIARRADAAGPRPGVPRRSAAAEAAAEARRLETPCPACTGKLALAVLGQANVEYCNFCGGVFLDPEELERAFAAVGGQASLVSSIASFARSVSTSGTIGG